MTKLYVTKSFPFTLSIALNKSTNSWFSWLFYTNLKYTSVIKIFNLIIKKTLLFLDKMIYLRYTSVIKNINLIIKKIDPFSDSVDYSRLSFRINNINLTIKKIYLSLGKINIVHYY